MFGEGANTGANTDVGRRRALKAIGGAALLTYTPTWSILRGGRRVDPGGPDVVVVTLDDCSPEYLGFYQSLLPTAYQGPIHTPELDALMADSWTSSSTRANIAVCAASRASFLTAAEGDRTGLYGAEGFNVVGKLAAWRAKVAAGELVSLPGFLTSQGLDTSARGKVDHDGHLFDLSGQIGEAATFTDLAPLFSDPAWTPNGFPGIDGSFLPYGSLPTGVEHVDKLRVDELIARINTPYVGQRVDFLGLAMPHTPRTVAQAWVDLYDINDVVLRSTPAEIAADQADLSSTSLGLLEAPYLGSLPRGEWMHTYLTEVELQQHILHMLATLSHTSYQIGRLRTALEAAGRPFVIVLTADHGYHLGEKGHYAKGTLYDKSLLVPMSIYSSEPNPAYPVGNATAPLSLLGLARTVSQLAGVSDQLIPSEWEGTQFSDPNDQCTLHTWGIDDATQSSALVFRVQPSGHTYKIIVNPGAATETYNLTLDPGEINNLAFSPPGGGAAQQLAEVDAELSRRARRQRARDWLAGGGSPNDPAYT